MDNLILKEQFDDKQKLVGQLLEEKYGEKFVVVGIGNFGFSQCGPFFDGSCYPEKDSELKFKVTVFEKNRTPSDSYSQAKLVKSMKKEIEKVLLPITKEYAILIDCESLVDDYELGQSAKEYNLENNCTFYLVLAINTDAECNIEPKPLYSAMEEMIKDLGINNGGLYVYFADEDEFSDIKKHCDKYTEIGSTLLDMCNGSFRTIIANNKMEKSIEEMIEILY